MPKSIQQRLTPYLDFRNFLGVNNTSDPVRVTPTSKGAWLTIGENVDIDDDGMLHRRDGSKYAMPTCEVIWGNGSMMLCVQDGALKRIHENLSFETLLSGLSLKEPFSFAQHNDTVYFSTSNVVGMVEDGVAKAFPTPTQTFKRRMVGGHMLEVFNNRLYSAQDRFIFFSDSMALTQMDERKNFLGYPGRIKMMKGLVGGMFVGEGNSVHWLMGSDVTDFVDTPILDVPVIPGSDVIVSGMDIGKGLTADVVVFRTQDGVYMGFPSGELRDVTNGTHQILDVQKGAAIYRETQGFGQYLFVGEIGGEVGINDFDVNIPGLEVNFN